MADIMLTLKDLEDLFWLATANMLNFDPASNEAYSKIRIAWQTKGAPAWGIDEDVVSIRVGEREDLFNVIRDYLESQQDNDNARIANAYTRVLDIRWVFYGPNSYNNASMVRSRLFNEKFREVLTLKDVYLVPDVSSPSRVPELFEGQWWDRTDLSASFNNLVSLDSIIPYLQSAEITINSNTSASVDSNTKPLKE